MTSIFLICAAIFAGLALIMAALIATGRIQHSTPAVLWIVVVLAVALAIGSFVLSQHA